MLFGVETLMVVLEKNIVSQREKASWLFPGILFYIPKGPKKEGKKQLTYADHIEKYSSSPLTFY